MNALNPANQQIPSHRYASTVRTCVGFSLGLTLSRSTRLR